MSSYINNKLFAYTYLPINNQTLLDKYPNSLILIGSENQLYQPLTKTYVGIGKTAYNNTIQLIDESKVKLKDISNSSQNTFKLLTSLNPSNNQLLNDAYFNSSLYLTVNGDQSYLYSTYFKGYLDGTSAYSLYSYNSDKILTYTNQDDNYYNILFTNNNNGLPYDAEVEYLEGDGLSYIDIGIIGSSDVSFQIDFLYKEVYEGYEENIYPLFGSRVGVNNKQLHFLTSYLNMWRYGNKMGGNISVNTPRRMVADNLQNHNVLNLTENNQSVLTVTVSNTTFTNNLNIIMFGLNNNNNMVLGKGRIYLAKWYVNDIIIRDFIPVRIGTIGYMYDKVSGELFSNSGTGNFVLGQDKSFSKYNNLYTNDLQYNPSTGTIKTSYFNGWLQGTANNAIDSINSTYNTYSYYSYLYNVQSQNDIETFNSSYLIVSKNGTGYFNPYSFNSLKYDAITNTIYANIDGNATTSTSTTKLKNSHTLWGQTFDGTQDVKGNIDMFINDGTYGMIQNVGSILPTTHLGTHTSIGEPYAKFDAIYGLTYEIYKKQIPSDASFNIGYYIIASKKTTNELSYYDDVYFSPTQIISLKHGILTGKEYINIPAIVKNYNFIDKYSIYSSSYITSSYGFIHEDVLIWQNSIENANKYVLLAGGSYISIDSLKSINKIQYAEYSYTERIYKTNNNKSYYITFTNVNLNNDNDYKYGSSYIDTNIYYNPYTNTVYSSYFDGWLSGTSDYSVHSYNSETSDYAVNSSYNTYSYYSYLYNIQSQGDIDTFSDSYLIVSKSKSGYFNPYSFNSLIYNAISNTIYANIRGTSSYSDNLIGNKTNAITYQDGENKTSFVDAPNNNSYLVFDGTKFVWNNIVNTNTDEKVKQYEIDVNTSYQILFTYYNNPDNNANYVGRSSNITINPNLGGIKASYFEGKLNGVSSYTYNLYGNKTNAITYQDGENKTSFISNPNNNSYLTFDGTKFVWNNIVNTNTDERVKYSYSDNNINYKLLFSDNETPINNDTSFVSYNTNITINPSTSTINASYFNGWLKGTSDNAINSTNSTYSTYSSYSYLYNVQNQSDIETFNHSYLIVSKSKSGYFNPYSFNSLIYNAITNTIYANLEGVSSYSDNLYRNKTNAIAYQDGENKTSFVDAPIDSSRKVLSYQNGIFSWDDDRNSYRSVVIDQGRRVDTLAPNDTLTLTSGAYIQLTYINGGTVGISHTSPGKKKGEFNFIPSNNSNEILQWDSSRLITSIKISYDSCGHIIGLDASYVKIPNNPNTDEKVRQYERNGDTTYQLLFTYYDNPNDNASYVGRDSGAYYNPYKCELTLYKNGGGNGVINADLNGIATNAMESNHAIDATNSTYNTYSYYSYLYNVQYQNDIETFSNSYLLISKNNTGYFNSYSFNSLIYNAITNTIYANLGGTSSYSDNLIGEIPGSIAYQIGVNETGFVTPGNNNQVLRYNSDENKPYWGEEARIEIIDLTQ